MLPREPTPRNRAGSTGALRVQTALAGGIITQAAWQGAMAAIAPDFIRSRTLSAVSLANVAGLDRHCRSPETPARGTISPGGVLWGRDAGGWIRAGLLLACLGAVAVPSCVIRIGPGDGSDGSDPTVTDPGQTDPGEHHDPETEITPEESAAAIEDLASADPMEAEVANYKAQYAAFALAGIANTTLGDLETVDEAQIQKIIDAYFPQVWEEADLWVSSLDPSVIVPQAPIKPADECVDSKYGCNYQEKCTFDDGRTAVCTITGCGINGCKKVPCPDLFPDLSKFFVKSWCTFTCTKLGTVIGVKLVLNILLSGRLWRCVPLETPVP